MAILLVAVAQLGSSPATSAPKTPTPPFTECPAVGDDTSCSLLIWLTDGGIQVLEDPSQPPMDGGDDTLVGVLNSSSHQVRGFKLSSGTPIYGFDGDGLCTYRNKPKGCPFGPTGYEGPGVAFSDVSGDETTGRVSFQSALSARGGTAYFSLEGAGLKLVVGQISFWTALGPSSFPSQDADTYVSGRVTGVVADPLSPSTLYVATGGGGVWTTDTSRYTWKPLSDSAPSSTIGSLAISHGVGKPLILYAGTGEVGAAGPNLGLGVLEGVQQDDGSFQWADSLFLGDNSAVGQVLVDENHVKSVFAATSSGLFESLDSGDTWALAVDSTGSPLGGDFTRIVQDPGNANVFWAAEVSGANAASSCFVNLWTSTDRGATWTVSYTTGNMADGPFDSGVGLASGPDHTAYTAIANCSGFPVVAMSWTKDSSGTVGWHPLKPGLPKELYGDPKAPVGQGDFDNALAVDPTDRCHALFGGIRIFEFQGSPGPKNTCVSYTFNLVKGRAYHDDIQWLSFGPISGYFAGTDGGFACNSACPPGVKGWTDVSAGLAPDQSITQFYAGEALTNDLLIGGTQDNTTPSTWLSGSNDRWNSVLHGDGGYSFLDPDDHTPRYGEQDFDVFDPNYPGTPTFVGACSINSGSYPYKCDSDYVQFPDPPFLADTRDDDMDAVAEATNNVYLSYSGGTDCGPLCPRWINSSGRADPPLTFDNTFIHDQLGFNCGSGDVWYCPDYISTMNINWDSFLGQPEILTASAFGAVRLGSSGLGPGQNWQDIGGTGSTALPLPTPQTKLATVPWITGVVMNPCEYLANDSCDHHQAWVTVAGVNYGAVYYTSDYTQGTATQWSQIDSLDTPATALAVVSQHGGGSYSAAVFVGTANEGVYTCGDGCVDSGAQWQSLGEGLSSAWITDLSCTTDMKHLVAWTYGRGVWSIPNPAYSPQHEACGSLEQSDATAQ